MKFLELFSGSGDISREMSKRGHECVTVDYDPKKGADICADVYGLFDETIKHTGVQLDWCKRPNDFLGRCSIPQRLIKDICDNIELLYERGKDHE